jgi:hypothetical protein
MFLRADMRQFVAGNYDSEVVVHIQGLYSNSDGTLGVTCEMRSSLISGTIDQLCKSRNTTRAGFWNFFEKWFLQNYCFFVKGSMDAEMGRDQNYIWKNLQIQKLCAARLDANGSVLEISIG